VLKVCSSPTNHQHRTGADGKDAANSKAGAAVVAAAVSDGGESLLAMSWARAYNLAAAAEQSIECPACDAMNGECSLVVFEQVC
jgi:hypothetical protein